MARTILEALERASRLGRWKPKEATHVGVLERRLAKLRALESERELLRIEWKANRLRVIDRWRVSPRSGPLGTVPVEMRWVRLLVLMEPGRWYGVPVLEAMIGTRALPKKVLMPFWEKARNPAFERDRSNHKRRLEPREVPRTTRGGSNHKRRLESRFLFRLNRWGLALRAKVLDDPVGRPEPKGGSPWEDVSGVIVPGILR